MWICPLFPKGSLVQTEPGFVDAAGPIVLKEPLFLGREG